MRPRISAKQSVLVLGDIIVDVIGRVKAWPEPGDDCLAPRLEMHCGGVAANCAFAFAGWGVRPRLLGCVGRDNFGAYLLRRLRAAGVDVRWVQRTSKAMTGLLYVNVTPDGQRTFFGSRAANSLVRQVARGSTFYRGAAGAHLVGYNFLDPATEEAARQLIRIVRARGGWIALDVGASPSQQIPRKILQLCKDVDILFVNRDEAAALTGTRDARKALRRLQRRGPRHVVMKLGKRGCMLVETGNVVEVPACDVRAVDSTGAGDAFVAAFLQGRMRGWSLAESAVAANAAGALAASVVGAGVNLPGRREVAKLLRQERFKGKWEAIRQRVLERLGTAR